MLELDIDVVLATLQRQYRASLSATGAAKTHYLEMKNDPTVTAAAREQSYRRWAELEGKKRALAARMETLAGRVT